MLATVVHLATSLRLIRQTPGERVFNVLKWVLPPALSGQLWDVTRAGHFLFVFFTSPLCAPQVSNHVSRHTHPSHTSCSLLFLASRLLRPDCTPQPRTMRLAPNLWVLVSVAVLLHALLTETDPREFMGSARLGSSLCSRDKMSGLMRINRPAFRTKRPMTC